jgi:hypothetical protein
MGSMQCGGCFMPFSCREVPQELTEEKVNFETDSQIRKQGGKLSNNQLIPLTNIKHKNTSM